MQLALLSDVHGNLEALEVVLAAVDARAPEAQIVCAGDVVGYGPDPEACLELLRERQAVIVMGNHEEMVLGRRDFSRCIHMGIVAAMWTRRHLAESVRSSLEQLPAWADAAPGVVVCHGDMEDANTYVVDAAGAREAFEQLRSRRPEARGLICGHTHHAAFFSEATGFVEIRGERTLELPTEGPYLINPGAVGQSRDGTVRAAFAVVDLERSSVTYSALPYDSHATIEKLRRAGLVAEVMVERPQGVARRLEHARTRVARWRAESPSRNGNRTPAVAPERSPIAWTQPPRRQRWLQSTQRGVRMLPGRITVPTRRSTTATVLVYRAITEAPDAAWIDPRFATPVDLFAKQVEFLARHRRVLSLTQLLELLDRERPVPPNAVVVTFDGGYRGVVEHAAPLLQRHGLPATIYLATGDVSKERTPSTDELYALFNWRTRNVVHLATLGPHPTSLYDPQVVRGVYVELHRQLVTATVDERGHLLSELRAQLRPDRSAPRLTASWDEMRGARELHPAIEIGVQTRDHLDLSALRPEQVARQILDSMADVRDALGIDALDLAYPFNRHSYMVRAAARGTGLRSAAVVDPHARMNADTDRFAIPRIDAPRPMSWFRLFTGSAQT
jgi:peptidoglycan/xylan/chitin deacetylase (PgdA/CDA1 family)/predicted phosphodiesterase